MKWQGLDGNIPDEPFLFVVPVNLVTQVICELHHYLEYGHFDVLPYIGAFDTREHWWSKIWAQAKNAEGRRIIITTPNVTFIKTTSSSSLLLIIPLGSPARF
jgi:hypothetical protein